MVKYNSIECSSIESIEHNSIDTSNLNNRQFRLNKISEIEDYFITEIKERELMSKKKILRALIQKFLQVAMVKQLYYQSVLYAVLKSQNLLKSSKQIGCLQILVLKLH